MMQENCIALLNHFKKNPDLWNDFDKNASKIFQQIGFKPAPEELAIWKTITEKLKTQQGNLYKERQTHLLGM